MKSITVEELQSIFKGRIPAAQGIYRFYSVLVPLIRKEKEIYLLYEVRSEALNRQPGEVCFPGGKVEEGETYLNCAIRETSEELNIPAENIKIISQLDFIHAYSDFTMYPFLGVIDYEDIEQIRVNHNEVKEVFLVPLSFLMETEPLIYHFDVLPNVQEDFPYEKINAENGYNWRKGKLTVPIYQYEGRTIWGLTARITHNLINIIKNEL